MRHLGLKLNEHLNLDVEVAGSSPVIPTKYENVSMDYTQMLGDTVELKCITKFIELGYYCSIPYGNSSKYDFIADIDGRLVRMQCKKSSYVRRDGIVDTNSIKFHTSHQTTNTKCTKRFKYNENEIDYFCTWFDGSVYVVPVNECSFGKTLYLNKRKYANQSLASDYNIESFFGKSIFLGESEDKYLNRMTEVKTTEPKKIFCQKCGKCISISAELCVKCQQDSSRKVVRPNRDVLKQEIRNESFRSLGKKYEVSDKTISKWCKYYSLPHRKNVIKHITDEEWEIV